MSKHIMDISIRRHHQPHLAPLLMAVTLLISSVAIRAEFIPTLLSWEMDRSEALPGDEVAVILTMKNGGDTSSLFPLKANVEGTLKGALSTSKLIGSGEPFPSTNTWSKDMPVTFGFVVTIPANTPAGEYNFSLFLNGRSGGGLTPILVNDRKGENPISIGQIKILSPGQKIGSKTKITQTFSDPILSKTTSPTAQLGGKELKLASGSAEIALSAKEPMILRLSSSDQSLKGSSSISSAPDFRLFRQQDSQWFSSVSSSQISVSYEVAVGVATITYHAKISCDGMLAAECDLFFTIAGTELRVGFENVRNQDGYTLTTITWPRLIESNSPDARMVTGRFSGRLIDPAKCIPGLVLHESTWIDPFVGGALYTPEILATMTTDSPGDSVLSSVAHEGDIPSVGLGVEFVHVISADGAPVNKWINAAGSSMIRIELVKSRANADPLTWMDAAKALRARISDVKAPSLYQDTVLYKILLDSKDYKEIPPELPATSFSQAREIMSQIAQLSDGLKQVVYLTGAHHEGQDTKYPDVFTINPKLGTYDDLVNLIQSGRSLNSTISFHSCATETYKDSPMWNEDFVARDPSGAFFVYNHFAGGECYWINQEQFAKHGLEDFINRVFSMYPITDTYHIDVLSTRASNVDFNPEHPCTPNAGYAGRLRMVQEFNNHGIDLTSEGFISWFVGKIGHAWLIKCEPMTSILGEEEIPFVPMIYHGHATYGLPSELNPLLGMLYGATFSMDFVPLDRMKFLWPGNSLADSLYLQNFPFQMLRNREMQRYERNGDVRRVTYDEDTYVEIDVSDENLRPYRGYPADNLDKFQIVIDGKVVAKDFTAFFPGSKADTYLAYSKNGGQVSYSAPANWKDGTSLTTIPLADDTKTATARVENGQILLDLPKGTPVRVSVK